jgi:trehalose 6-phosphate phosphatase
VYENGRRLVERAVQVLSRRPSGLFSDIDGTISPIVERSEDACVEPRARAALDGLAQRLDLVAVVTGRNAADARRMLGLDNVVYVGNHGLEIDGDVVPEARPWVARLQDTLNELQVELTQPGVHIENKGVTASIHYREAQDYAAARTAILAALAPSASSTALRVEEGRLVFNILPPLDVNKGSAVTWLAREHALRGVAFIGDDVTDSHAFRALTKLREGTSIETLSIAVVSAETPASVRQAADATLPNVNAVADLMCSILERLQAGGRMDAGSTEHTPE